MFRVWGLLILLSLSMKRPKKHFSRHRRCRLLVIKPVHCGSISILLVNFFGTPCVWCDTLEINGLPWKYSIAPTKRLRENEIEATKGHGQGDVGLFWDQRHKSRG